MSDQSSQKIGSHIALESMAEFFREARQWGYAFIGYDEAKTASQFVIMRHDVDVDLHYANRLAEIEARHEVASTFFVMLRNPLYNLFAPQSLRCIGEITGLGHKVALHFDVSAYPQLEGQAFLGAISRELTLLKELAGPANVSRCVTFHKPNQFILETEIETDEFFSGYNREFFRDIRYIADSGGRWREESMLELIRSRRSDRIQFNSHPVWWIAPGESQKEKLAAFLKHRASNADIELAETINDPARNFILHTPLVSPSISI
jgi:hypothetical protein